MKIKALVASDSDKTFAYEDVELDEPKADEILVQIKAAGLCHTDILARDGLFQLGKPAVLGHEGAGVVERVGKNVTKVKAGDRVAISFRSCEDCPKCEKKLAAYCRDFVALNITGMRPDGSRAISRDGEALASNFFGQSSFATHAITYESNVVVLPDDMPFDVAAPLGCGVQTGAGTVLNSLNCEVGSSLIVTGCGIVGLSAVMAGKINGCQEIIAIEPVEKRREQALSLGATHVIDPLVHEDFEAKIREIVPDGVNYAVDTTGRPATLDNLTRCFTTQGTLAMVGMTSPTNDVSFSGLQFLASGLTVKGIIEGDSQPDEFIPQLIAYYKAGKLPLDKLISTYKLKDINQAIKDHHSGLCTKAVLLP